MMQGDAEKLWTRPYIFLCLANLLSFLSFHMLVSTFPFYVKQLGGNDAVAGLVAGLFSVASLITRPLVGWGLDHVSRRRFVYGGLIGMTLLSLSYGYLHFLPLIALARLLHGAAWSCSSTSNNTNLIDLLPPHHFGEGMGYFGLMGTVAMSLAPAVGLALKDGFGFPTLFAGSALVCLGALLLVMTIRFKPVPPQAHQASLRKDLKHLFGKEALPAAIPAFFFIMPFGAITTFVALYAAEHGVGSGGVFFSVMAVCCVLSRAFGGRFVDRRGEWPLVGLSTGLLALALLLLAFSQRQLLFYVAASIFGFGYGFLPPALQVMSVRVVKPARRGAASSTYLAMFDLGTGMGGIISGQLVERLGYSGMFAWMIAPLCCCALVYYCWSAHSDAAFHNARRRPSAAALAEQEKS